MINLVDHTKYGLMLWGTKLGAQVFAMDNISSTETRPFTDLREIGVKFENSDAFLFSYEHQEQLHAYTIYRSLLDWRSRSGYYAITVFVSDKMSAPLDKLQSLLLALSNRYYEEYYDKTKNQIYENLKEKTALFTEILQQNIYQLSPVNDKTEREQGKKGYINYATNAELDKYLSFLHPTEEPDLDVLWLLKTNELLLPPESTLASLMLPSYPKNAVLKVIVLEGASPLRQVSFSVVVGNRASKTFTSGENGSFEISDLSERDTLKIRLDSDVYELRGTVKEIFKVKDCKKGDTYQLEFDLRKKPEMVMVTVFVPTLKKEINAKLKIKRANGNTQEVFLNSGTIEIRGLMEGEYLTIMYEGSNDYQPKTITEQVSKDKRINLQLEIIPSTTTPTKEPTEPKGENNQTTNKTKEDNKNKGGNKISQTQLILAVLLGVAVLTLFIVLIVTLVNMFSGNGPTPPKENPIVGLEKKINAIDTIGWAYNQDSATALRAALDKECRDDKIATLCKNLKQKLDKAIEKAKFRAGFPDFLAAIDSAKTTELDSLTVVLEKNKNTALEAFGDTIQYINARDKLEALKATEKPEDVKKKEPKTNVNDSKESAVKSILSDSKFDKITKTKSLINTLDATKDKKLISQLNEYLTVCEHLGQSRSFEGCLNALSDDAKKKIDDNFSCSTKGMTIKEHRVKSTKYRDYSWLDQKQKDVIKDAWENLKAKLQDLNPNYQGN